MSATLSERLRAEVCVIGDLLLQRVQEDEHGASWPSVGIRDTGELHWSRLGNLWSGSAGIGLFLLELHGYTGDSRYLRTAEEGFRWAENDALRNGEPDCGLYTGTLGVAMGLMRLAHSTDDSAHLGRALRLVEHSERALDELTHGDLMSGAAGALLGLLHLYHATGERRLLDLIARCEQRLYEGLHCGRRGVYWDRSPRYISGLCGLAHGAGGVGLAFMELARLLDRPALHGVAEQAFLYEDDWFDPEVGNWPDLRAGIGGRNFERHLEELERGDERPFVTAAPPMAAWCHGSVGIGMIRLHAHSVSSDGRSLAAAQAALEYTRRYYDRVRELTEPWMSYALCHGLGGAGELFLHASRVLEHPEPWSRWAMEIAERALRHKDAVGRYLPSLEVKSEHEDCSLFLGDAGVGYFFLRLLSPERTASVLLPRVGSWHPGDRRRPLAFHASPGVPGSEEPLLACLRPAYARTLEALREISPATVTELCAFLRSVDRRSELVASFEDRMGQVLAALPDDLRERLHDLYSLEKARRRLDLAHRSHSLVAARRMVAQRRAASRFGQGPDAWVGDELRLSRACGLLRTRWRWSEGGANRWCDNLRREAGSVPVLHLVTAERTIERELSRLEALVLDAFSAPRTPALVARDLESQVQVEVREPLRAAVLGQIREAIRAGVLVHADSFAAPHGTMAPGTASIDSTPSPFGRNP